MLWACRLTSRAGNSKSDTKFIVMLLRIVMSCGTSAPHLECDSANIGSLSPVAVLLICSALVVHR